MEKSDFFKKSKIPAKESWYIFTICTMSLVLIVLGVLFFQNPFLTNNPEVSGLSYLGQDAIITVEDNGSGSQSFYFYGSVLPNMKIDQNVSVTLKPTATDCAVRAKVYYIFENQALPLNIITTSDWQKNNDGYYYLNQNLVPNLTTKFLQGIITPSAEVGLNSANIYSYIVSFETLPTTTEYEKIWKII